MGRNVNSTFYRIRGLTLGAVVVGLLLAAPQGQAQTEFSGLPEAGVPVFDLDLAAFRAAADSARIEVYYRITNPRLSYVRRDSAYVASYEITAILTGRGDRQAAAVSNRENYTLNSYDETRRSTGFLVNVLSMTAAKGEYELAVTLDDRLSGGTHTEKRPVDLRRAGSANWVVSDPEYYLPDAQAPREDRFHKDTAWVVPNVTRTFVDTQDRLAAYFEIYNRPERPVHRVAIEVRQRRDHKEYDDTLTVDSTRTMIPVFYRRELPDFRSGQVELRMQGLDAQGKPIGDPVESYFQLEWSLFGMVEKDWTRTVDMLVHIATHDELEKLRSTPPGQRLRAFEEFWKSKDPSPETEENEWRDEYYRRIRFANRQYSNPFQPGWRTDFGMVYIKYGEPDEVERFPFELGQKPHEIWYYYGQRRQFTFVDERGNGEYELQYPYDGIIR